MPSRAMKDLITDHEVILQALEVFKEMTDCTERGLRVDRDDIKLLVEFLREFVHVYHDGKEQAILLPALIAAGHRIRGGPLGRIAADHREICGNVEDIEAAIDAGDDEEFADLAKHYVALLIEHLANEDHFVFEAMDQTLDDEADLQVLQMFMEFEPELREQLKSRFDKIMQHLEDKYGAQVYA